MVQQLSLTPTCLLIDTESQRRSDGSAGSFLLLPSIASSSFLDLLHSLDPPPSPFLLSLALARSCPWTHRLHSLFCRFNTLAGSFGRLHFAPCFSTATLFRPSFVYLSLTLTFPNLKFSLSPTVPSTASLLPTTMSQFALPLLSVSIFSLVANA